MATVIIAAAVFRDRVAAMQPARLLTTPFWVGRPLGVPGDREGQRQVLRAALALLDSATQPTVQAWLG